MVRLNTSRPSWSVPNQYAELGGLRILSLVAIGDVCAISPGKSSSTIVATVATTTAAWPSRLKTGVGGVGSPRTRAPAVAVVVAMLSPFRGAAVPGPSGEPGRPGPRVNRADDQVDDEVDDHVGDADHHDGALHHRDVLVGDRGGQEAAQAGAAEDHLGDRRAGQDVTELQADGGDGGDGRVPERVPHHHPPLGAAPGPRRLHVLAAVLLDQ